LLLLLYALGAITGQPGNGIIDCRQCESETSFRLCCKMQAHLSFSD